MRPRHVVLAGLLCLFLELSAKAQDPPIQDPPLGVLNDIGIDQHLGTPIPLDGMFRDETGQSVALGKYFGTRPVILVFVYYECPMLCTLTLNGLVRNLRAIPFDAGNQFEIVTVSFDPHETPELAARKKRTYLDAYLRPGAEAGWHFLTGDAMAIGALTRAAGFRYTYDPESRQWAHATGLMVLTPDGRLSRYFYGIEYSARDLRLSLVEAADRRIGSPVDRLLLYCYHYDPATGKYGWIIMNVLRIAGLGSVLLLAGSIVVMIFRDDPEHSRNWK